MSVFVACTSRSLDLGTSDASAPAPSDGASAAATGRWTGYLENYKLPSGSDAVVIETTSGNGSELNGTVVFGARVLPPATDPDVGYPPGYGAGLISPVGFAGEGFAYHLQGGTLLDARLKFQLAGDELWGGWCGLQTPYEIAPGHYGCLPNTGTELLNNQCFLHFEDGGVSPIDCGKMTLCGALGSTPCKCTMTSCAADMFSTLSFDLVVAGDVANGTVTGLGDRIAVHLTRAR
jgi:hypothetical protein